MTSTAIPEPTPPLRFRPRLWSSLATVIGIAILLALGTWQVERLAWKTELIATADARSKLPPVPLAEAMRDPAGTDFRPAFVTGRWLPAGEMFFGAEALDGVLGTRLVTPLVLPDGKAILVDRGYIPEAMMDPATRPDTRIEEPAAVTGVLRDRAVTEHHMFQPDNEPATRRWYGWDMPAMGKFVGFPLLPDVLVIAPGPGENGTPPIPRGAVPEFANNHLGYAITWFGLAASLAAVYIAFSLQRGKS